MSNFEAYDSRTMRIVFALVAPVAILVVYELAVRWIGIGPLGPIVDSLALLLVMIWGFVKLRQLTEIRGLILAVLYFPAMLLVATLVSFAIAALTGNLEL